MNELVKLDQNAVRTEIERQIATVSTGNYTMTHNEKLLSTIDNISDNTEKADLLHKYLDALSQHQSERNTAMRNEVLSKIKINELITNNEIDKDKTRTALFNSRALIIFVWCFPIAAGFAAIKLFDSFVFATFIILVLYGALITLYFSQSNGLSETLKSLANSRRDL